ncbi:MAG: DUF535 family protein [Caldimonas sp.]
MWSSLLTSAVAEIQLLGAWKALKHMLGSLRALLHPERARRAEAALNRVDAHRWLPVHEQLYYVRHRFYLSKYLSVRQRIDSCTHHYTHEAEHFSSRYRKQVYGGQGLTLWQESVDGHSFRIRLAASSEMRWEGDLSLRLFVDEVAIHVLSFSYVDAGLFGQPAGTILFITRNQSLHQGPQQSLFRTAFKQTVPPYFCLSATIGIALAQGMQRVAAIRHEAQIASSEEVNEGLRNTYDGFWRAFNGSAVDAKAFALPVPLAVTELSEVNSKHRKRARDRRGAWSAVTNSAQAAIAAELQSGELAPVRETERVRERATESQHVQSLSPEVRGGHPRVVGVLLVADVVAENLSTTWLPI